ncbi:MAG: molybdenum cofactor guanylyltransferase [Acidobacteria bacterium]|nr:molybdenum cofactor guanylyltransferase [Acidobacteriota bacterium]
MRIQGFVLTGGASRRMGRNKAAILMSGQTLAQNAVNTLREFCGEVFTVGGQAGFSDAEHLIDIEPPFAVEGRAAMTGIYTALRSCRAEFAAVLACDMPNVTADVFRILIDKLKDHEGCDAVIPVDAEGKTQQLCAVLHRERCLAAIERLPADRTPAVKEMLALLNVVECPFAEFPHLPHAERLFANLNTPEELSEKR